MLIRKSGFIGSSSLILKYNRNHQYNTQDVTKFYWRADIFKYLCFPSITADTSHIPSTITLTKLYLST